MPGLTHCFPNTVVVLRLRYFIERWDQVLVLVRGADRHLGLVCVVQL